MRPVVGIQAPVQQPNVLPIMPQVGWYNKTLPVLLSSKLAFHSNSSLVKVRARQFLQAGILQWCVCVFPNSQH